MSQVVQTGAARRPWIMTASLRLAAWGAVLAAVGLLVRAEVRRSGWPVGVVGDTDIVYRRTGSRRLRLDVYEPEGCAADRFETRPAVLAIHGGGWSGGSRISFGQMVARLAQHGYVVVSVDYSLCRPGKPSWPAALDDVRAAVRWIDRHAPEYRIDSDRVVALGASAGGHLAALLGANARGESGTGVRGVVDFYGPSDLRLLASEQPAAAGTIAAFLGGTPATVPERYDAASPARQVSRWAAPMLLIHGVDDADVPPAQSRALSRALGVAGVPSELLLVPAARHGFEFRLNEGRDLLPAILAFLERACKLDAEDRGEIPGPRAKNANRYSCISRPFLER